PIADTGEHDLVRGGFARLGSVNAVAGIAPSINRLTEVIKTRSRIEVCQETRAIQGVIEPSMEVAFQATLDMADMSPATMDADIANRIGHQNGLVGHWVAQALIRAVGARIAHRRANLATVSDVARIWRANRRGFRLRIVEILTATTGYAATKCRR